MTLPDRRGPRVPRGAYITVTLVSAWVSCAFLAVSVALGAWSWATHGRHAEDYAGLALVNLPATVGLCAAVHAWRTCPEHARTDPDDPPVPDRRVPHQSAHRTP